MITPNRNFVAHSLAFVMMASLLSCENESNRDALLKEISVLEETKSEEKRIDSMRKASGIPVQMTIDVTDTSFHKTDPPHVGLAFINESVEFQKKIIYIIKYDKRSRKILSVERAVTPAK